MVESLKKYVISTKLKSGVTNKLCYCRACFNKLGKNHSELKTIVDKTDRILKYFKNCSQQEKDEVFSINKQENTILDDAVKEFDFKMLEKLALDRIGITLSFDGWTNVHEQELMGMVLTSSDGQPYIWKACNISSERVTNIEVRSKVEEMISELDKLKIPLLAIVTNSAPAYSEIFKVSSEFKTTSQQALKLAVYFKNANNKYFIGKLQDIQMEIYGKCIQPAVSDDTRWNSYFNCFTKFEPPAFTTRRQPTDLPHEIYNIIINRARLFEVLYGFAYLYQFWQKYPNSNMADGILIKLERRWEFYLHMGKWLIYYYKAWTGKEPVSILKEFDEFSQGIKYPFDDASVAQFDNKIYKYWC
ncbi:hypothetical protein C1646_769409 [Rhizophagus diaphanus]|nr:hypothetical protein C1646_769409 [Rhizophagus diaphanus] [Rhizophagus sp. MUCL 43196]